MAFYYDIDDSYHRPQFDNFNNFFAQGNGERMSGTKSPKEAHPKKSTITVGSPSRVLHSTLDLLGQKYQVIDNTKQTLFYAIRFEFAISSDIVERHDLVIKLE